MGLMTYFFSYIRSPEADISRNFPAECLGQSFPNPAPISSVCRRVAPGNPYHYDTATKPVGFIVT
jgi:hypothetical protein